ncbi:FAD-dependent monooxygenase [Breoghania sp.]|uniref:FAD-dependent monooxygenase n=1 Tax=Breoghania sp. TaxID=2065378 RepID=UPI0026237669|nr:FAD-dependent monooxygenase [Breoghania sp.]MDJ0932957.1 FAD-dependent monooxygenase [Breoghania sp.]
MLAGDAAHMNKTLDGAGLNEGIQDAYALCKALVEAVAVDHPQPLVDYVAARRRTVERRLRPLTDMVMRALLYGGGRMIHPVFASVRMILAVPGWRRRILRRLVLVDPA